jgi:hypothetical protein
LRGSGGERIARLRDLCRIDPAFRREGDQQGLLACHMIEHTEQEVGLARGQPDRFRPDPGEGEEAAEPFRLAGDEAQGGDREFLGRLSPRLGGRPCGRPTTAVLSWLFPFWRRLPWTPRASTVHIWAILRIG